MSESAVVRVKGRPPRVRGMRHFGGRIVARAHGWADGTFGSLETIDNELDRYKERAEEAGRRAAHWWADVARDLEGECTALENRIDGARADESRLTQEVAELKKKFDETRDSHDEGSWRDHDHELDLTRAQQQDLRDRLDRVRAQRKHGYEMARNSAEQFKDYFEGLMKSYCAGNRKASRRKEVPKVELPPALAKPSVDGETTATPAAQPPGAPAPAADTPPA